MTKSDPAEFLPTTVQKSYFMLSRSARAVLDTALRKYRPGRTDLIPVGGIAQLKPALHLTTAYRLMIREVTGAEVVTSYTRWLECVQVYASTVGQRSTSRTEPKQFRWRSSGGCSA